MKKLWVQKVKLPVWGNGGSGSQYVNVAVSSFSVVHNGQETGPACTCAECCSAEAADTYPSSGR